MKKSRTDKYKRRPHCESTFVQRGRGFSIKLIKQAGAGGYLYTRLVKQTAIIIIIIIIIINESIYPS